MRLGQLSRKIGIQPSRISTFLEGKNYTLEAGSNSKLTEEQEELIKAHFDYVEEEVAPATDTLDNDASAVDTLHTEAPATDNLDMDTPAVETDTSESQEEEKVDTEVAEEAAPVVDTPIEEELAPASDISNLAKDDTPSQVEEEVTTVAEILNELELESDTKTDKVIRAPKLKLDGLKVVGKIDLPEPKVKEEAAITADDTDSKEIEDPLEEVKEKPVRRKIGERKNYNRRPTKRTLTLEEKQEREERTRRRKNKAEKEKQKQLKTAYYESKMREQQPAAPKKNKRKAVKNEPQEFNKVTQPAPKTILGKFLRWLNT